MGQGSLSRRVWAGSCSGIGVCIVTVNIQIVGNRRGGSEANRRLARGRLVDLVGCADEHEARLELEAGERIAVARRWRQANDFLPLGRHARLLVQKSAQLAHGRARARREGQIRLLPLHVDLHVRQRTVGLCPWWRRARCE